MNEPTGCLYQAFRSRVCAPFHTSTKPNHETSTSSACGILLTSLFGCTTVKYGDKETEANLRKLTPIPAKASLYVCREAAVLVGAGNRTTVLVNDQPIGTLKPNNFAHTVVDPGTLGIKVKRNPGGESGVLTIPASAGEVPIVWVGMTGGGFGVMTVDHFSSRAEAEQCVKGAAYAVRADP